MLVFPEPVTPKRSFVGVLMDFRAERAERWAEFKGASLALFGGISRGELRGERRRRDFSTPTGRIREATEGRGER